MLFNLFKRGVLFKIDGSLTPELGRFFEQSLVAETTYIQRCEYIFLSINSDSGSLVQAKKIADCLKFFSDKRSVPVYAFAEGQCCGPAFLLLSSANLSYASPFSLLGDLNITSPLTNYTDKFEYAKAEVNVLQSGDKKTRLNPYKKTEKEDLDWAQNMTFELEHQLRSEVISRRAEKIVAKQKKLENIEQEVLDKGLFSAETAFEYGLIDGIRSRDEFIQERISPKKLAIADIKPFRVKLYRIVSMEFERAYFRVYQSLMKILPLKYVVTFCMHVSLVYSFIALFFFLYAFCVFQDRSVCLSTAYKEYFESLNQTTRLLQDNSSSVDSEESFSDSNPLTSNATYYHPGEIIFFSIATSKNSSFEPNATYLGLKQNETNIKIEIGFSSLIQAVTLPYEQREEHKWPTHNISIDHKCYETFFFSKVFLYLSNTYETILINEILNFFIETNVFLENTETSDLFWFFQETIEYYQDKSLLGWTRFPFKILAIMRIFFGLFLVSAITALYIKISILAAPAFLHIFLNFCNWLVNLSQNEFDRDQAEQHNQAMLRLYQAFPWHGVFLITLRNKEYAKWVSLSFILFFVVFYAIYIISSQIWTLILFTKSYPSGLEQNIYGFIAFVEFFALIFVRTRSTIRFYPRISYILLFSCFCVFSFTLYSFYFWYFQFVYGLIAWASCYCWIRFEYESQFWNPSYFYTPSNNAPRTMFFPAYVYNWKNETPPFWTMFFPLVGREAFSEQELSLANGNQHILINYLRSENQNQDINWAELAGNFQGNPNRDRAPAQNNIERPQQIIQIELPGPMGEDSSIESREEEKNELRGDEQKDRLIEREESKEDEEDKKIKESYEELREEF